MTTDFRIIVDAHQEIKIVSIGGHGDWDNLEKIVAEWINNTDDDKPTDEDLRLMKNMLTRLNNHIRAVRFIRGNNV